MYVASIGTAQRSLTVCKDTYGMQGYSTLFKGTQHRALVPGAVQGYLALCKDA